MKIYRMTATFGKLEHETLTLQPGLNIITAPNEWGKSTWCAFLMAMFYGLDTRSRSTKGALADKDRYAPWSGAPMAGRIDLNWQGRDITIERAPKGRSPMANFKAYETASGMEIPELTAANCGQMLLGVEQSVFRRAGFLRQADLPVTQDEALRRRLNDLVTTGDESGSADRLARELKDLKNKCRFNRTGLLPQTESQRDQLQQTLSELTQLETQKSQLESRLAELKRLQQTLENHQAHLNAAAALDDAQRVAQARQNRDDALDRQVTLETICGKLPPQEEVQQKLRETKAFREEWNAVVSEQQTLPRAPLPPAQTPPFVGMEVSAALDMVDRDRKTFRKTAGSKFPLFLYALGVIAFLGALSLLVLKYYLPSVLCAGVAVGLLLSALLTHSKRDKQAQLLEKKYGTRNAECWDISLRQYEAQLAEFTEAQLAYEQAQGDVEVRLMVLGKRKDALCGDQEPDAMVDYWQQALTKWQALENARREASQAETYFRSLSAMAKTADTPTQPDTLTYSQEQTTSLLAQCVQESQHVTARLGQYRGRVEALGNRDSLQTQLNQLNQRIAKLKQTYTALSIAQEALQLARAELQRRFAPQIAQRAQELLNRLTLGRYDRLTLGENFDLQAATASEDTLHDALWRSDGTIDQLYLALRLAVAEALTPEAPLILDDALVRFDDARLKAALDILREEGAKKQVILFSCQGREEDCQ